MVVSQNNFSLKDNMADPVKGIEKTILIFNGLMVLGFLGIVWLIIYGNLSGNFGFQRESASFTNETINLTTAGAIPSGAQGRVFGAIDPTSVLMTNATEGQTLTDTNYTLVGVVFTIEGTTMLAQNVNVTYSVSFAGQGERNTESVINNLTSGAGTFFGFSNLFFTIIAIVLLITLLLGLLLLVVLIVKAFKGGKGGGSFSNR